MKARGDVINIIKIYINKPHKCKFIMSTNQISIIIFYK